MKKTVVIASLLLSSLGFSRGELLIQEPYDLPITTFKVTYDSSREFNDSVQDAFVTITGDDSVGEAIRILAETGYVSSAECDVEMCKVEWSSDSSGEAGGKVGGTGLVGGVSGELTGKGSQGNTFKIDVPCHMLFETMSRLRKIKDKKEGN